MYDVVIRFEKGDSDALRQAQALRHDMRAKFGKNAFNIELQPTHFIKS